MRRSIICDDTSAGEIVIVERYRGYRTALL